MPGTPVLASDGAFVGMVVIQMPDPEDMEGAAQAMGGSRDYASLILPAADVVRATTKARAGKGEGEEMSAKAVAATSKPAEKAATSKPTVEEEEEE